MDTVSSQRPGLRGEIGLDAMENAFYHWWGHFLLLEIFPENKGLGGKDVLASTTMKDMVIVFVKTLAVGATVVCLDSVFLGTFTHDFVGGPEFEGKFVEARRPLTVWR